MGVQPSQGAGLAGRVAGFAVVAALLAPGSAAAAPYLVTDDGDAGVGTLRAAIDAANLSVGVPDTITFNLPAGTEIELITALPSIADPLDIQGPGAAQLAVNGNQAVARVFENSSTPSEISGLTIKGGSHLDQNSFGSGVRNGPTGNLTLERVVVRENFSGTPTPDPTMTSTAFSAGIHNNGVMTIDRSWVTANQATVSVGAGAGVDPHVLAVGIGNAGVGADLTVRRTTVSGNIGTATGISDDATVAGAGIGNTNSGVVTLDRATVTGNSGTATGPPDVKRALGMGVYSDGTSATITSSTVAGNPGTGSTLTVSNLYRNSGTATGKNTLIAVPVGGANCGSQSGTFFTTTSGHNLESPADTCGLTDPTDQKLVPDAGLAELADNGGATLTLALLPGSPAIDTGIASVGETGDQRDLTRPLDLPEAPNLFGTDFTDIGAFEVQLPPPPSTQPPPAAAPAATGLRAAALKKCKKKKSTKARKKCRKRAKKLPV